MTWKNVTLSPPHVDEGSGAPAEDSAMLMFPWRVLATLRALGRCCYLFSPFASS
jgi:hypothetical protein